MFSSSEKELLTKYAPTIMFDALEPFVPVLVGCTIAEMTMDSPSFPRKLLPPKGGCSIEYAIYWDWDIGHHYELEHLWVHVDSAGNVSGFEGSAHGLFISLWPDPPPFEQLVGALLSQNHPKEMGLRGDRASGETGVASDSSRLIAYSQPGKHGFAPEPGWFQRSKEYTLGACSPEQAGEAGLLGGIYENKLGKNERLDSLCQTYLKRRAFVPSLEFSKKFPLAEAAPLVPWDVLYTVIPKRVDAWMRALENGLERPPEGEC